MDIIQHVKDVVKVKVKILRPRSSKWSACRKAYLIKNPFCAACGCKDFLEVHHIQPFNTHPELELLESNLITLCEHPGKNDNDCHLYIGHNGCFRYINNKVIEESKYIKEQIESNPNFDIKTYLKFKT